MKSLFLGYKASALWLFVKLLPGVFFGAAVTGVAAQNYPTKPIRMIVPFVAGGSYDSIARILAQEMSEDWQQPIVIDNRPGASGIIGTQLVARAAPDGYTIAMFGGNQTLAPAVRAKPPYDLLNDFEPITRVALLANVIAVHPSVPVKSLKEFIALLKANPGKYYYGSGGNAGATHFATLRFTSMTGVNVVHVPYRGGGLAANALISNEVQMMMVNILTAKPLISAGRLRGLAVAARTRSPILPDIPSTGEAGLPGYEYIQWYGVFAPAGTPNRALAKLRAEINRVVSLPDVKAKILSQGAQPMVETPKELEAFVKQELELNRKIAKDTGILTE